MTLLYYPFNDILQKWNELYSDKHKITNEHFKQRCKILLNELYTQYSQFEHYNDFEDISVLLETTIQGLENNNNNIKNIDVQDIVVDISNDSETDYQYQEDTRMTEPLETITEERSFHRPLKSKYSPSLSQNTHLPHVSKTSRKDMMYDEDDTMITEPLQTITEKRPSIKVHKTSNVVRRSLFRKPSNFKRRVTKKPSKMSTFLLSYPMLQKRTSIRFGESVTQGYDNVPFLQSPPPLKHVLEVKEDIDGSSIVTPLRFEYMLDFRRYIINDRLYYINKDPHVGHYYCRVLLQYYLYFLYEKNKSLNNHVQDIVHIHNPETYIFNGYSKIREMSIFNAPTNTPNTNSPYVFLDIDECIKNIHQIMTNRNKETIITHVANVPGHSVIIVFHWNPDEDPENLEIYLIDNNRKNKKFQSYLIAFHEKITLSALFYFPNTTVGYAEFGVINPYNINFSGMSKYQTQGYCTLWSVFLSEFLYTNINIYGLTEWKKQQQYSETLAFRWYLVQMIEFFNTLYSYKETTTRRRRFRSVIPSKEIQYFMFNYSLKIYSIFYTNLQLMDFGFYRLSDFLSLNNTETIQEKIYHIITKPECIGITSIGAFVNPNNQCSTSYATFIIDSPCLSFFLVPNTKFYKKYFKYKRFMYKHISDCKTNNYKLSIYTTFSDTKKKYISDTRLEIKNGSSITPVSPYDSILCLKLREYVSRIMVNGITNRSLNFSYCMLEKDDLYHTHEIPISPIVSPKKEVSTITDSCSMM